MEEKYLNIKIKLKRNNEIKLIEYKYKKRTHDERPMALDVLLQAQEIQYDDLLDMGVELEIVEYAQ